jgi:hypothetical protein
MTVVTRAEVGKTEKQLAKRRVWSFEAAKLWQGKWYQFPDGERSQASFRVLGVRPVRGPRAVHSSGMRGVQQGHWTGRPSTSCWGGRLWEGRKESTVEGMGASTKRTARKEWIRCLDD